jgi:hypothetical protein
MAKIKLAKELNKSKAYVTKLVKKQIELKK